MRRRATILRQKFERPVEFAPYETTRESVHVRLSRAFDASAALRRQGLDAGPAASDIECLGMTDGV